MPALPRLTRDVPALPGAIRSSTEDFRVSEVRLYEPVGSGDHVHFQVEKRDLTTSDLIRAVARALDVEPGSVGCAGLKDARGVTRQTLSVEHRTPEAVLAVELDRARVISAERHTNKLRRGHLAGNRFRIVLRDTEPERIADVRRLLERLASNGLPNAFGPQRFGNRGDTGTIGAALVRSDFDAAARAIAGAPGPDDHGAVLRARELFDAGRFEDAAALWPRGYATSAQLCLAMARSGGRAARAVKSLPRRDLAFYVSAWQAELFNHVLGARLDGIGRLEEGEVAWNHGSRRSFEVRDLAAERERAERFEVSPTGPMVGSRMERPTGEAARLEEAALRELGVDLDDPHRNGPPPRLAGSVTGARRPLRVPVTEASVEAAQDDASALVLAFTLPAGAYATALLHELCGERLVTVPQTT